MIVTRRSAPRRSESLAGLREGVKAHREPAGHHIGVSGLWALDISQLKPQRVCRRAHREGSSTGAWLRAGLSFNREVRPRYRVLHLGAIRLEFQRDQGALDRERERPERRRRVPLLHRIFRIVGRLVDESLARAQTQHDARPASVVDAAFDLQ